MFIHQPPWLRVLAIPFAFLVAACETRGQATNCVEITCPEDMIVECRDPAGTPVFYTAIATNHCDGELRLTCFPRPGTLFPPGTTVVRCVATDGLTGTNECTFSVTVRDTTPPEIFCPSEIRVPCSSRTGAIVHFRISAIDNCDTNVSVSCDPPSGSLFPIGTNMVTCSSTDAAGNVGQCVFPVVVESGCTEESDCIVMNCPEDIFEVCDTPGGKIVEFTVTAEETCGRIPPTVTCEPPSGSLFPIGVTVVICTATTSVATNQCAFAVYIRDEMPPVLTCPDPIEVEAEGMDGAIVEFEVSATDDCSTNLLVVCHPPSGSIFPVGTTRVQCLARDEGGNETSCILPITVRPPGPMEVTRSNSPPGQLLLRWTHKALLQWTDSLSPPNWQNVEIPIVEDGMERSVEVATVPNQRFFKLIPDPLAPPPDADGDGVPDADDLCPDTPSGQAVDACGCSPVQIVQRPGAVMNRTMTLLQKALTDLEQEPAFDPARGTLANLLTFMEGDADFMKRGEVESAADRYSDRVVELAELEAELARLRPQFERPPIAPGDEADFDEYDERNLLLNYLIRQVSRGREAALVTEACFNHARDEVEGTLTFSGRVAGLSEAGNRVQLESGEDLFFAESYGGPDTLSQGASVTLSGVRFKDGTTIVTEVQAVDSDEVLTAKKVSPLQLAIAPWQYFNNGPWILHHPLAYEQDETLHLELGMRFATRANPVPSSGTLSHALRLRLIYKTSSGGSKAVTLANALKAGDKPIELPADMALDKQATLIVRKMHFPAPGQGRTSVTPEVIESDSYAIRVRPRYAYARAEYSQRVFDLEDSPIATGHVVAQVVDVDHWYPLTEFTAPVFVADGYAASGGGTSYPSIQQIGLNTPFGVFSHDFYNPEWEPVAELLCGTTQPSALRWPRVVGFNNGFAYSYACALPKLVKDRVAACGTTLQDCFNDADTFYRFPFIIGYPVWTMGQGNCGLFSHFGSGSSQYAYDFRAPEGTPIRAARGGVVIFVEEDNFLNCCPFGTGDSCFDPCPFDANSVVIEHQDGTVATYAHMPQNGVIVNEGDRVRRGDPIAVVGNTGFSTRPHLHFIVRKAMGDNGLPSRFQAVGQNCYRPATGDLLLSNNKAWYE